MIGTPLPSRLLHWWDFAVLNFKSSRTVYHRDRNILTHQCSIPLRVPSDSVLSPQAPIAIGILFGRLPRPLTSFILSVSGRSLQYMHLRIMG